MMGAYILSDSPPPNNHPEIKVITFHINYALICYSLYTFLLKTLNLAQLKVKIHG